MNNGLNQTFYDFVDRSTKAFRNIEEQQEKLLDYNRKLVSVRAVTYDRIGDKGEGISNEDKIIFYLDKIDKAVKKVESCESILNEYYEFMKLLIDEDPIILSMLVKENMNVPRISEEMSYKKSYVYEVVNGISRQYSIFTAMKKNN